MSNIVLNCDAHGLGDLMITMWISEGSKDADPKLIHFGTGARETVLRMFNQEIATSPEGAITTFDAYDVELKCKGRRPRVNMRGEFMGIMTPPKRPIYTPEPERMAVTSRHFEKERKCVLLFPDTAYQSRQYPVPYWVDLAWKLNALGYQVKMMMQDKQARYENTPSWYYGLSIQDVACFMLHASLVIGNDSGPCHLAGTMGVQSIALIGATNSNVFAHVPSVHCLQSNMECTNCYFQAPFRAACDQGCSSLMRLFPELVVAKVQEIIGGPARSEI